LSEISDGDGFLLRITAVCNAGLLLDYEGYCILVDGTAYDYLGFSGIDENLLYQIATCKTSNSSLCGVLSTHCHPDHYNKERTHFLKQQNDSLFIFTPDDKTAVSGCIQCGPFCVYYHETEHMPHSYEQVRHYVFFVTAGSESVYIAADAKLDAAAHRNILRGMKPKYLVVNPVYLTAADTICLLQDLTPDRIFVYHVPVDPFDRTGMRRKAERSIARCASKLPPILLADVFPKRLV